MVNKTVKVGIRLDKISINLFGAEEVNSLISQGWRVVSLTPGAAIFTKMSDQKGSTSMVLSGCEMAVLLLEPDARI